MINVRSKGAACELPIRFEAVMGRENVTWVFYNLQFSYLYNIILEDRMDDAVIIE